MTLGLKVGGEPRWKCDVESPSANASSRMKGRMSIQTWLLLPFAFAGHQRFQSPHVKFRRGPNPGRTNCLDDHQKKKQKITRNELQRRSLEPDKTMEKISIHSASLRSLTLHQGYKGRIYSHCLSLDSIS